VAFLSSSSATSSAAPVVKFYCTVPIHSLVSLCPYDIKVLWRWISCPCFLFYFVRLNKSRKYKENYTKTIQEMFQMCIIKRYILLILKCATCFSLTLLFLISGRTPVSCLLALIVCVISEEIIGIQCKRCISVSRCPWPKSPGPDVCRWYKRHSSGASGRATRRKDTFLSPLQIMPTIRQLSVCSLVRGFDHIENHKQPKIPCLTGRLGSEPSLVGRTGSGVWVSANFHNEPSDNWLWVTYGSVYAYRSSVRGDWQIRVPRWSVLKASDVT